MTPWTQLPPKPAFQAQLKAAFERVASDKPAHSYERVYASLLPERPIHAILEIGISNYGGEVERGCGSLFAWHSLYPNCAIYGGDHKEDRMISTGRIQTHLIDQNSQQSLDEFAQWLGDTEFDVIIDDASHVFTASRRTLACLLPKLAPGGMYFVEDVARNRNANNWQQTVEDWWGYLAGTEHQIIDARPEFPGDVDSVMICLRAQ